MGSTGNPMSFRNPESASEFLEKIEDPIVKSLVRFSYQTMDLTDGPRVSSTWLYFFKVMEEFLRIASDEDWAISVQNLTVGVHEVALPRISIQGSE